MDFIYAAWVVCRQFNLRLFGTNTGTNRFSATNCAKLYDVALSDRAKLETGGWQFGLKLTPNHIWDGFVIKSLLDDCDRNQKQLQVDHGGDQNLRFHAAMEERNERMILLGQDEVPHYCDRCMRVWEDEHGNLRESFGTYASLILT